MKTNLLLIIILVLFNSRMTGQKADPSTDHPTNHSVSLQFGLNQIRERDLLPLVHKGSVTELAYETEKIKGSMRQFQLLLSYSRLKTSLEEMAKSANIGLGLNYSYDFLVLKKNNLRYYAGPQASLQYSFMMYPNWDESHSYWADYLSFGAGNMLTVSFRHENEWFSSLYFSLLGFFSRPDPVRQFKMDSTSPGGVLKAFNSNIETGFPNKLLLINYKTEYRFPVFTHKREAFTFNMNILRMSRNNGEPVFQIINTFGIKIML
jgi:hypothetical protein